MKALNGHTLDELPPVEQWDCTTCGDCCRAFGIIEVQETEKVPRRFTLPTTQGYRAMGSQGFACICLQPNELCSIYEDRPASCRNFIKGSQMCRLARLRALTIRPLERQLGYVTEVRRHV